MKRENIIKIAGGMFLTFTAFTTMAQTEEDFREKLTFGLKAGANYSNVYDEKKDEFQANWKPGFAGGVFLSIPIGRYIGVQPEVLVSQKGFEGSGRFIGSPYTYSTTTTFLDVPVLFMFKPSPYVTILAGPQYSFLLSERNNFNSEFITTEEFEEFENDNIRKNIFGVNVGVDVNIKHFVISPRAGWDFQENHGDGTSSTPRYKNQWLQLTLGYRF